MSRRKLSKSALEKELDVTGAQTEAETETLFASDDSGSEDEDMLETELFDDSDNEKEYFPDPADSSDEEYRTPPKRTRGKKRCVRNVSIDTILGPLSDIHVSDKDEDIIHTEPPKKRARGEPTRFRTSTPRKHISVATADSAATSLDLPAGSAATTSSDLPAGSAATTSSDLPAGSTVDRGGRFWSVPTQGTVVYFKEKSITAKNGFKWNCRPCNPKVSRTQSRNIIPPFTQGPTLQAQNADTPEKCFNLFFDDQIINEIVKWTNKKIEIMNKRYKRQTMSLTTTKPAEVRALLGILLFSASQRDNHLSTLEMFNPKTGNQVYRSAMSEGRFSFLISCLRFDDPTTRDNRKKTDPFAAIRTIWDIFIGNCEKMYTPSENLTIDEQLLAFKGKCPFRMYIPSKPAKYGIKLIFCNDNNSKYLVRALPYLGKKGPKSEDPKIGLGHHFTKYLTQPYHHSSRNVTTDNWFTSVDLVQDLLSNCGMTLVGTLRTNKKEVPAVMKDKKKS
ncbi:UNVERIFIED_CONTAM: hypothetical protein RMT77_013197 [Armadillidium vulgare]